jgi:isoleucyl-tRNA synthetase
VPGVEPSAVVNESTHCKCARCWKFLPSVGQHETFADLCDRCAEAVAVAVA